MIRSIIGASLRFWMLLIAIAVGVMAIGIVQLRNAPVDVLPEFTPPYVEVQTEALGLSADEVEQMITVPLEADLLNGVEGVDVIRSESVSGLSDIVMVFESGTDVYHARQLVQERLTSDGCGWACASILETAHDDQSFIVGEPGDDDRHRPEQAVVD